MNREIIVNFGYRSYVFYSDSDVTKARKIYIKPTSLDEFEEELEELGIDFHFILLL